MGGFPNCHRGAQERDKGLAQKELGGLAEEQPAPVSVTVSHR